MICARTGALFAYLYSVPIINSEFGRTQMTNAGDESILAAREAIEQAVRDSYGRLLAFLAARSRNVDAAEDALADAFQAALESWPRTGVPDKPEAWLLVAARRKLVDVARHARVHAEAVPELLKAADRAHEMTEAGDAFPDERLKLMFVCAHPTIDAAARTPLMLQTVLGLDAARIASAFLVKPSAMGQRLSRAKAKVRLAGIRFVVPGARELPERLESVLEAIYAAYGSGWDDIAGADPRRSGLALEAIGLGRLLAQLMPHEPEVKGLLALMLHCEARRKARRTPEGNYVPLLEQNVALWSKEMMDQAERFLSEASRSSRLGRFQLEAAIQSAHAQRAHTGQTDWRAIELLYEGLVGLAPTIGAQVGRAAAVAETRSPATAWSLLEAIPKDQVNDYQPYWALAAHLLKRMNRSAEAADAYNRAIGLCEDPAMREYLRRQAMGAMKRVPNRNTSAPLDKEETERTFARVVDAFATDRDVTYREGKGFGSTALKVRGKIFAMISSKGQFVAKLSRGRVEQLVEAGAGQYFDAGRGRLMKDWIAIDGAYSSWIRLAGEAREFVGGGSE